MAMTNSPGLKFEDWPNFITGRFLHGIRTVAKSDCISTSSTVPENNEANEIMNDDKFDEVKIMLNFSEQFEVFVFVVNYKKIQ